MGDLRIQVMWGDQLPMMDINGAADPYVIIKHHNEKAKTTVLTPPYTLSHLLR